MASETVQNATGTAGEGILEGAREFAAQLLASTPTEHYARELTFAEILLSLAAAAVLGYLIASHPKRHIESGGPVNDQELKKSKILICVAGATLVALIQGSLELAFGLVGLGGLVRYRTALRNPVDLSIIFILIGLGMACGLQLYEFAVTITAFIYLLLYVLDAMDKPMPESWTLKADCSDPGAAERVFAELARENRFVIQAVRTSAETGRFRCRFTAPAPFDKEDMGEEIKMRCGNEVHFARIEWDQSLTI